ncbi:MAG: hypothetical protein CFE21_12595 [Bacteroidetes bacterium B1(2017)]|nr:MAG: hypothetical protein CFE21_12595 [Bacteroidetes bacterium B1(2017)]
MNAKKKDYLIIGGGIAGLMIAHQLRKAGKDFLLVDRQEKNTSSKIAAGMFNPISGKRMSVNWKANELLNSLHSNFTEFETLLEAKYLIQANIHQAFGNIKESNDFASRLDVEQFKQFVNPEPKVESALIDDFGTFEVIGSGWVKTSDWMSDFQNYLEHDQAFFKAEFEWTDLLYSNNEWHWQEQFFSNIISCEGYQNNSNPYFNWLPFKLCKGQVLLIKCPGLNPKYILKRGVYLVHQYEDVYKVGASYEWDFEDARVTTEGKENLIEKVKHVINLPFEVIDQIAGIRPTTRDRAAILGAHPIQKNLFIFNGLGTKGMLQAPFLSEHMASHLLHQTPLFKEVDIDRFKSFYPNGQ